MEGKGEREREREREKEREKEKERGGMFRRGQLTSSAGSTGVETNKSRYRHRDRYVLQDRSFDRSRLSIEAVIHAYCLLDRSIDRSHDEIINSALVLVSSRNLTSLRN